MNGSADTDDIGSSQGGVSGTAITLNASSSFITLTDSDGLVDAETIGSSGDLNIDGTRRSSSKRTKFKLQLIVQIIFGVEFTITGTNVDGTAITEIITGPTAGATVTSSNIFKTVTRIQTNGAASAVNVGTKSAFVNTDGKRASITSSGGDETQFLLQF